MVKAIKRGAWWARAIVSAAVFVAGRAESLAGVL